jgi:hypothetical protein
MGFEALHAGGSAGAVTPSKFSDKIPMQGVELGPGVGVDVGAGVPLGAGVGVGCPGVGVGVPVEAGVAVGVGAGHALLTEIVSTCHPGAATASSEPIRKRNLIV